MPVKSYDGRGEFPREETITKRLTEEHKDKIAKVIINFVRAYGEFGPNKVRLHWWTLRHFVEAEGFEFDESDPAGDPRHYFNHYLREPTFEILRRLDMQTIYDLNIIRKYRWRGMRLTDLEQVFDGLSAKRSTSMAARWHLIVGE
jgi:hypothetical protein